LLFVLPIAIYLIFSTATHNSLFLPTISKANADIPANWVGLNQEKISMKDKITVLGFIGQDVLKHKGNVFNLYENIFDRNNIFKDFQMVMIMPDGTQNQVKELQKILVSLGTQSGWNFVFGTPDEILEYYDSLKLVGKLDAKLGTPNVFIIDKNRNLRGRKGQDKKGKTEYKEGYNTKFVSELCNQMIDDIKIILAEYRLALKKNHNATKQLLSNEK
jgi:hypothetical protein